MTDACLLPQCQHRARELAVPISLHLANTPRLTADGCALSVQSEGGSALDAGSSAYWKALQPHRKLDEVL